MLVRNFMTKKVITVDADESMQKAIDLIKNHRINMLPVVEYGRLVGVISDSDLKRASASEATVLSVHELKYLLNKIKVRDIMTPKVISVPPDFTIEETAEVLLQHDISGAPVIDHRGELVGIITRDDLFKALISLSGLAKRGIQFGFQVEDRPGSIKELTDLIRLTGGRIASILSSYDRVRDGWRNVYIRAYDLPRDRLPELIKALQEKACMLYMVDHRENIRQVFDAPAVSFQI